MKKLILVGAILALGSVSAWGQVWRSGERCYAVDLKDRVIEVRCLSVSSLVGPTITTSATAISITSSDTLKFGTPDTPNTDGSITWCCGSNDGVLAIDGTPYLRRGHHRSHRRHVRARHRYAHA